MMMLSPSQTQSIFDQHQQRTKNERSSDKAKENNKSLCLSSSNNIANNNSFFRRRHKYLSPLWIHDGHSSSRRRPFLCLCHSLDPSDLVGLIVIIITISNRIVHIFVLSQKPQPKKPTNVIEFTLYAPTFIRYIKVLFLTYYIIFFIIIFFSTTSNITINILIKGKINKRKKKT